MESGFSSQSFSYVQDMGKFDPSERFKHYDFWEIYDKTKLYPKEEFEKEHEGKVKIYLNSLYTISERNSNKRIDYVISEELYDDEELKSLIRFCPCSYCQMYWFNPKKLITCPCCVGCISSLIPMKINVCHVKKARMLKLVSEL